MAATGAGLAPGTPGIVDSEEFARLTGLYQHTVTDLAATGALPPGVAARPGERGNWLFNFPAFYAALAGPGVPFGEIVGAAELGRRIKLDPRSVRRLASTGSLPGLQLGKLWLFAVPAVWQKMGWPLDNLAVPREEHAGPAAGQQPGARAPGARRGRSRSPAALDVADAGPPQPAVAGRAGAARRAPGRSAGPGRPARPGSQARGTGLR